VRRPFFDEASVEAGGREDVEALAQRILFGKALHLCYLPLSLSIYLGAIDSRSYSASLLLRVERRPSLCPALPFSSLPLSLRLSFLVQRSLARSLSLSLLPLLCVP
jgi:hypothetical protein